MTVKLILEFTEEERQQFEMAYRGVEYYSALTQIQGHLRQKLKYGDLSETETAAYEKLQGFFFEVTDGLDL